MKLDRTRNPCALVLALVLAITTLPPAQRAEARAPVSRDVQRKLDRWLTHRALKGVRVGVAIADLESGAMVASHQAHEVLNPASGAKLLTTAAALALLGPQHSWTTSFDLEGSSLLVTGGGDPKLLPEEIPPIVDQIAKKLHGHNVSRIDAIRINVSRYDRHQLPPAYAQKSSDAGYRPAIGSAGSSYGAIRVDVRPTRVGYPVEASVNPKTGIEIVNEAVTTHGKASSITIKGEALGAGWVRILVRGELGVEHPADWVRRRVPDPNRLTAELVRDALVARGLADPSTPLVFEREPKKRVPSSLKPLHRHPSDDLTKTIDDINTWSNNYMAEVLFKELGRSDGRPASWERAAPAITQSLSEMGVNPAELRVVNGSGLYRATLLSTGAMAQLLVSMDQNPTLGPPFRESLARPGRAGTMSGRLRSPNSRDRIWAKTGTLDEVVSLSGYIQTSGGHGLAFAIFINEANATRTGALRAAIDRLVVTLTRL
jgi:serine-type D-Ala-D-Ala carboxypeptidase/endopeptidase (penicillin-binding protein 4)